MVLERLSHIVVREVAGPTGTRRHSEEAVGGGDNIDRLTQLVQDGWNRPKARRVDPRKTRPRRSKSLSRLTLRPYVTDDHRILRLQKFFANDKNRRLPKQTLHDNFQKFSRKFSQIYRQGWRFIYFCGCTCNPNFKKCNPNAVECNLNIAGE